MPDVPPRSSDEAAASETADSPAAVASDETSKSLWRRLGPTGLLGLLWASAPAIAGFVLLAHLAAVSEWFVSLGGMALPTYIGLFMVSAGLGLLPTYAQAIMGGWVFGFAAGFPGAMAGFTGAAIIGYAVTRLISGDRVREVMDEHEKARLIRAALVDRGFWGELGIVTLVRIPPNSPFAITNLVMASCGVAKLPFTLGTLFGMAPRTGIVAFVASAAAASTGAEDIQAFVKEGLGPWVLIGGIAAMIIMLMVLAHIANKALAKVLGAGANGDESSTEAQG